MYILIYFLHFPSLRRRLPIGAHDSVEAERVVRREVAEVSAEGEVFVIARLLGEVGEIDHRKFACARGQGGEEVASDCGVDYAEFFYGAGEAGVGFLVVFGYRQWRCGRCKLRVGDIF